MKAFELFESVADSIKEATALLEASGIDVISVEKRWNADMEIHVYNGIEFLASQLGQELSETSNPLVDGTVYRKKSFTVNGIKYFQVPNSNGEYREKKDDISNF